MSEPEDDVERIIEAAIGQHSPSDPATLRRAILETLSKHYGKPVTR